MTDKWTWANVVAVIAIFGLITWAAVVKQLQPTDRPEPAPKQDRANFKMWEIILPDYAHSDTLVVVDPDGLNRGIDSCDGSDSGIAGVLYQNCLSVMRQPDYGIIDLDLEGYTIIDYYYRDTLRIKWGTNIDSLLHNWND